MEEMNYVNGVVSVQNFKVVLDRYYDFCKKLRFLIKGALATQEATLVLEIILDFLNQDEQELHELTRKISREVSARQPESEPIEVPLGPSPMQNEDFHILQKIAEIRKSDGERWELLQAIIQTASPDDRRG